MSVGGEAALPLAGIRVLEFGHTVMGPSSAMVLAAAISPELVKQTVIPLLDQPGLWDWDG